MDSQRYSLADLISLVLEADSTSDPAKQDLCSESTTQLQGELTCIPEAADKSQKCHLLEIAPELRNSIYEYLLNTGDLKTCHPQILATCKRINSEASGILYGNQQITIRIREQGVFAEKTECGELILEDPVFDTKRLYWPSFLDKVQHLRILRVTPLQPKRLNIVSCGRNTMIRLRIEEEDVESFNLHRLNVVLYSLCTHLAKKNAITSAEIDVAALTDRCRADSNDLEKILYPLAMLKDLQKLDVYHYKPDACIGGNDLLAKIKTNNPRPDLLKSVESVIEDAETCEEILRLLPQYQPFWERTMFERLRSIRNHLQPKTDREVWMTREREKNLLNAKAMLRQVLSYVDTTQLGEQLCNKVDQFMGVLGKLRERQGAREPEDKMESFAKLQFRDEPPVEGPRTQAEISQSEHTLQLRRWNNPAYIRRSDMESGERIRQYGRG